ncbi:hypothetical protein [Lactococcus lactis]|uniref:hypothetical protein n=2 Tax=Streptococcaceae TaxID=1300 RepID=UPI000A1F76D5|nr:hypothetical protein [Lactococcus lactis]MCT0044325.1 hypothetical protein [Lactococcus lactis subsp. lactis]OSP88335.1 hypothetical protein B9W73_00160 [Lactococcus lactis]PFG80230.1 hypothetical protein BW151_08145 [Lactococcus lactis]RJK90678.1 hypothetical protein D4M07_08265 [Lactococcus lactis subsp. lactis]
MKKTSFMKRLSLSFPLFWLTLCCFILGQFIKSLKEADGTSLSLGLEYFSLLLGTILLGLTLCELFSRVLKDAPINLMKSIIQTLQLRHFLYQQEVSKIKMNSNTHSPNPITAQFNRSMRKSMIDITQHQVAVLIKVPHTQQGQKLLKTVEGQIKEELSSRNTAYFFSEFERHKNGLWLIGTRK